MNRSQIVLLITIPIIVFVSFFCGYVIGRLTEILKRINADLKSLKE